MVGFASPIEAASTVFMACFHLQSKIPRRSAPALLYSMILGSTIRLDNFFAQYVFEDADEVVSFANSAICSKLQQQIWK